MEKDYPEFKTVMAAMVNQSTIYFKKSGKYIENWIRGVAIIDLNIRNNYM